MHVIETKQLQGGVSVRVVLDECAHDLNPLDWEQAKGKREQTPGVYFITFQRRSSLPDWHHFDSPEEVPPFAEANNYTLFNLYYYEHGNCAYNVSGFSCPWDSGQVGYVLVKNDEAKDHDGLKRIAEGFCDTVTSWCNGEVYGYIVSTPDDEYAESCWGFIGEPDYCMSEGLSVAEHFVQKQLEAEARVQETERPDMYGGLAK